MNKQDFLNTKDQYQQLFNNHHIDGYEGTSYQWIFYNNQEGDYMDIFFTELPVMRILYMPPFPKNITFSVRNPYKSLISVLGQWTCEGQDPYNRNLMIETCVYQLLKRNETISVPHYMQEAIDIMTVGTGLICISSQFQLTKWGAIALWDPALQKVYTIASSKPMADGQYGHMLRTYTGGREYQMNSKRVFKEGDYNSILEYLQKYRSKVYLKLYPEESI